ncbi:MFS transporter [Pseudazoarcus pumilus]|uniref:MFS transporter n=1 Tax=Pseudazoarcus pumilus TaxID=2067960 RepID=A0A2I6S660_9RHOO|nr:MFS transporter [Pseudazoarcus pumilus]AUN94728.1 MFS transporter [Pseudazoarcus pumilus]
MFPYWRLSTYYFFYFGFVGAFSPYFTLYLQSLDYGPTDIAVLMSVMQVMRVLAPSLWGWLAERTGLRVPIVRASAIASLAGFCPFFFTTDFAGMFLAMVLMAFFWSAALPLVESLTFAHLGALGHRYGRIRLWGSLGFIVAVVGLGYLLDFVAIDRVLVIIALVLVGIVACAIFLPEAAAPTAGRARARLGETLRRPEVVALLGACFFMAAAHGAWYVFYSIHLADHGYGKAVIGWMWALGVIAEIGVFLIMPALATRFGMRAILLFSFAAAVLRFLLIGWGADSFALLVVGQLLHGVTFGAYHAAAIAMIARWFPGRLQAHGQALYGSLSFGAGGMLGGLLGGVSWDTIGAGWTFTTSSSFALVGLIWLMTGWRGERSEQRGD